MRPQQNGDDGFEEPEHLRKIFIGTHQEYEQLKTGSCCGCDLNPLSNILKRTAEASVTEDTVLEILEEADQDYPVSATRTKKRRISELQTQSENLSSVSKIVKEERIEASVPEKCDGNSEGQCDNGDEVSDCVMVDSEDSSSSAVQDDAVVTDSGGRQQLSNWQNLEVQPLELRDVKREKEDFKLRLKFEDDEDEIRRPRARGPRCGRGVRVRGGVGTLPVVKEAGTGGPTNRGDSSRRDGPTNCGRSSRRGGRAMFGVHHLQPGPNSLGKLILCDILEMPAGHSIEMPLHPKRTRAFSWQPSNEAPAPPPLQPQATAPPPSPTPSISMSQQCDVKIPEAPESLAEPLIFSPACSVPSPAMVMECRETSSVASRPRQLNDDDIDCLINLGSDVGSDESDDDDDVIYPALPVPRVFRSIMETPLDRDEAGDVDTAGEPAIPGGSSSTTIPPMMTDQPWRWYDFKWKKFPNALIPPKSRRETFSQNNVGPTTPLVNPYDIFVEIWDRQIMEHIVSETNRYAQQLASQMMANNSLHPTSRICRWRDTTVDELYVYFGIVLAMGIVVKSRFEEYWRNTPDIFCTPGFSAHMSINRFILLNKCLHFNNNEDMCALELDFSEAKLFKIQPILSHLNYKFQSMYIPAQNIALDESLLEWKGCLNIGQLIPSKAANRGIKTYEICESQTGYLWRFEVHAHKKSPPQQFEDPLAASIPSIVLRLVSGLENNGYTLWMDNYYNSPCLARRLKSLGFDCVGTLRTDRQFVPQALHSLTKRNMRPGQISGLTSGDVDVMVWRHINRVSMISTYHGIAQKTQGDSTKPILIFDYNIMMGGVDKKDQLLAMYSIERKRTKVWYKKLFRRLLNVSVLNSYIIQRRRTSLKHRTFRISLIESLLARHSSSSLPPTPRHNDVVDITHRLAEYPFINTQRQRRVCVNCKKRVHTFCVGCNKTACIDPCFVAIHS